MDSHVLLVNFDLLNGPKFLAKSHLIYTCLDGNPHFPCPWGAGVPSYETLKEQTLAYGRAYAAAEHRDTVAIGVRDECRETLTVTLKYIAHYLEIIAAGDRLKLATTGYDLRRPSVQSHNEDPPAAPSGVTFVRGPESGTGIAHGTNDPSVNHWEVQVTSGDPTLESNWSASTLSEHNHKIVIRNLVPGKIYHSRMRGWNKNGYSAWTTSSPVAIV